MAKEKNIIFRIEESLRLAFKKKVKKNKDSVSGVLTEFISKYVNEK